jgi:iron(III) transport system permease protein
MTLSRTEQQTDRQPRRRFAARQGRRTSGFTLGLPVILTLFVLLPLAVLLAQLFQVDVERWQQMTQTFLPRVAWNTLTLMVGVGIGTFILGSLLAWLTTNYDFPGRRWFDRLLLLPLAVPGFIMGFVYVSLFEYAGPVQTSLRSWFGWERGDYAFPNIASPGGLILVLTLVLYPYVYLLARAAFLEQAASSFEAAQMMGCSRAAAFMRLGLPLALPQILAGTVLAVLEAMTDYGTVSYFGYPTVSERIVVLWNTEFEPRTATQLALLMMVAALGLFWLEQRLRGRARFYHTGGRGRRLARQRLSGIPRWAAFSLCALVFGAAFVLPVAQLLLWTVGELQQPTVAVWREAFAEYARNSFLLASSTAALVILLAVVLTYGLRAAVSLRSRRWWLGIGTLGYAMPGAVIAAGVLIVVNPLDAAVTALASRYFGWSSTTYLLTGTVAALIYAYTVRFLSIGIKSADASFAQVSPNMEGAARTLGAGSGRVLRRIHFPLIRTGLAAGAILVFVDVMKELPATLLLRPFGMDTLALRTYFLSVEGWHRTAAVPALTIVLIGLVPVFMLMRIGERPVDSRSRHSPE